MADAAQALGFEIMIGCMVATSLAMAPAMLLAQQARFVDLDGPLLLARDRDGGLRYDGSRSIRRTPRSGADPRADRRASHITIAPDSAIAAIT